MTDQQPRVGRTERACRLDVLVLEDFQRCAADDAGEPRRVDERERGDCTPQAQRLGEDGDERERQQQRRERQENVHRPHDYVVREVTVVRCDDAGGDAEDRRRENGRGSELQRVPRAVQDRGKMSRACPSVPNQNWALGAASVGFELKLVATMASRSYTSRA